MSLINDALKRAKHAQQKSPPPPSPGPALRPVEPLRRKQSNLDMLLPLALVLLVGVGGLILWFAMRPAGARPSPPTKVATAPNRTAPPITQPPPPTRKPATTQPVSPLAPSAPSARSPVTTPTQPIAQPSLPVVAANGLTASPSTPVPAPTQPQVLPAQPVTAPTSTPPVEMVTQPVVVVSEPPPPPPLPKVQGIIYLPERPAVLLNGKTVLIGGTSGEYRVVAISQQSATVVRAGQTNILNMPD